MLVYNKQFIIQYAQYEHKSNLYKHFLEYLETAKNPASLSTNVYTSVVLAIFPKYLTTYIHGSMHRTLY